MSGKTIRTSASKLDAMQLQSSTRGGCVPWVRGVTRIPGNLGWYDGFKDIPHTETQGGKGGAGKSENTTFTYVASALLLVCRGPIIDIPRVWVGKELREGGVLPSQIVTTAWDYAVPASGAMQASVPQASALLCLLGVYQGTKLLTEGKHYLFTSAGLLTVLDATLRGTTLTVRYQYRSSTINRTALTNLGFSLLTGHIGQPAWAGFSAWPSASIGYSGHAGVVAKDYSLGESAQLENHLFEVVAPWAYHLAPNVPDVDPAAFLRELLIDDRDGAGFPADLLGDWQRWSDYCVAAGLLVSPALTEQTTAADIIKRAADLTNAAISTSSGKLQIIPRADSPEAGLGRTYTPNLTPVYDLDDESYTPSGSGASPVRYRLKSDTKRYNTWSLEFRNRANAYATDIADAKDAADIQERGVRANPSTVQAHWICTAAAASKAVQLMMQRSVSVLSDYEVPLPPHYSLIDLGDLLTLTDTALVLDKAPVFVTGIDEDDEGNLLITCEDYPIGSASAAQYAVPEGIGYMPNWSADPGDVDTPVIIEGPAQLAGTTGLEVYVAARGSSPDWGGCQVWTSLDGSNYKLMATLYGASRYGALSAVLAGGATSLGVDGLAAEQLNSGSAADAAQLATLCFVGGPQGEFLAYQGATLTGAGVYTLSGLVRGAYGSPNALHPDNAVFVRLDERIARSGPLDPTMVGQTLHVKCLSFNRYRAALQSLADVDATTYTITGQPASYNPGIAGKGLTLQATSPIFHYPAAGGVTPASITFTAERKGGLLGAVSWSVVAGTATLTGSGDTRTLAAGDLSTDGATIRASITDGLATYAANYTVSKTRDGVNGSQGPQGPQGTAGPAGANGQTSYFHTAYASSPDGTVGFNQSSGPYIGTYVDFNPTDSSNPASYTWRLFQGAQGPSGTQGIPGSNGANGQTSYLHIKYSNDGGSSFTANSGETPGSWIGQYVDFTAADSTNPASYTWSLIKGDQGPQGLPGATGAAGASAPLLVLLCDAQSFKFTGAGAAQPAGQVATFTALQQNLSGAPSFSATLFNAAGASLGAATLGAPSAGVRTLSIADFGAAHSASVTVSLGAYSDVVKTIRVQDGIDGSSPVSRDLSNDNHTLSATAAGVVTSYAGASTAMTISIGLVDDTSNWSFSRVDGPGITSTISGNIVTITNMIADIDSSYVDITATRSSYPTQTVRFTVPKIRSAAGSSGVLSGWFVSASDYDGIAPFSMSASVTLETNGAITTTGDYPVTRAWYAPATAGIGASHWVQFSLVSGEAPSGVALNTWLPLSTARTPALSGPNNTECLLSVRVATDSSGSNVVGAGSIDIGLSNSL